MATQFCTNFHRIRSSDFDMKKRPGYTWICLWLPDAISCNKFYFWSSTRWRQISAQVGSLAMASVSSDSTAGISMFCGQILTHLPQPMQAEAFLSSGSPSIRCAVPTDGAKRMSLATDRRSGISSPAGHPSQQYRQEVHGTELFIPSAISNSAVRSASPRGWTSSKHATFSFSCWELDAPLRMVRIPSRSCRKRSPHSAADSHDWKIPDA